VGEKNGRNMHRGGGKEDKAAEQILGKAGGGGEVIGGKQLGGDVGIVLKGMRWGAVRDRGGTLWTR